MNVVWTDTAQRHLDSIFQYIANDSKHYALKTIEVITRRSVQIGTFPLSGKIVPEIDIEHIREVIEGNYRIIYQVGANQIDVLAVLHSAQEILRNKF